MTSSFAMMINTTKVRPRVFLLLFFSFVVVGFRARGKERTFALEGDWTRMDFYASSFYAKVCERVPPKGERDFNNEGRKT